MALPNGYKQLEYIQSSGTQYIDTGYYPKWNTRVVMDVQMSPYSASRSPFGCRNSNSATASAAFLVMQTGTNTLRSDYFGSSKTLTLTDSTDQRLTIDQNKNVLTVNGQSVTNTAASSGTSAYTLLLFTYGNSGSAGSKTSMALYSCKIYENDVLVRDFIPCKNASGTAGLWDDVNSVFYANAGSGSFIDPTAPKGKQNTLINGASYEITEGKCLVNGTAYKIYKGRTLVAGTGYDIILTEMTTVTITGVTSGVDSTYDYVQVNGTKYRPTSSVPTRVVKTKLGSTITVGTAAVASGGRSILLDGTAVASGAVRSTYTHTMTGNITATFKNMGTKDEPWIYIYLTTD